MMKRTLFGMVAALSLATLLGACAMTKPPQPTTSLWKVTSPQRTIYIASDPQVLSAADYPLPKAFTTAFSDATHLYLEQIPPVTTQAKQTLRKLLVKDALLPGGKTLDDLLTPGEVKTVKAAATKVGLPYVRLKHMKPWALALAIGQGGAARKKWGIGPEYQLTRHFYTKAQAHDITVTPFEKYAKTFGITSSLPMKAQINWLVHTAARTNKAENMKAKIHKITQAWRVGNTAAVKKASGDFSKLPKVRQALVVNRNHAWVQVLEAKLQSKGKPIFVVVGSGHLMGADNMLSLLRGAGYQVRQM